MSVTVRFQEVRLSAEKRMKCDGCGKRVVRKESRSQTINPFNRLDSPYQREAQVRIAGVLIRNAVALQDIGALSPGYGTKAEAVAREILLNCYPDEDTHDPNTAALIRQVKREGERARQLEATNAALVETIDAADDFETQREVVIRDKTDVDAWDELDRRWRRYRDSRQTLATDHGIPLPGEGDGS